MPSQGWFYEHESRESREPGVHKTQSLDRKRAYVDRSTNWVDWGVFVGQNVDGGTRNRSWWTGWTVVLTLPR